MSSSEASPPLENRLSRSQVVIMALVALISVGLLGISFVSFFGQRPSKVTILDQAERYVRFRKAVPLSESLEKILSDKDLFVVASKPHPLMGKSAPTFSLRSSKQQLISLDELLKKGPVVVVFYYGYYCDHCIAQLVSLDEDFDRFAEIGASVVAISADSPDTTAKKVEANRREFRFPLLSDNNHQGGIAYGTYTPATDKQPDDQLHGTFVISREGKVIWVDFGDQPFIHNQTLLYVLAKAEGRLPAGVQ